MSAEHMFKFHVLLPGAIAGILLLFGLPFPTAVVVGMMAGCVSMAFMRGGGSSHDHGADRGSNEDRTGADHSPPRAH